LTLLFLGGKPATAPYVMTSKIFTIGYFCYFAIVLPIIPHIDKQIAIFKEWWDEKEELDIFNQQNQHTLHIDTVASKS
jgi:hypothetical protein